MQIRKKTWLEARLLLTDHELMRHTCTVLDTLSHDHGKTRKIREQQILSFPLDVQKDMVVYTYIDCDGTDFSHEAILEYSASVGNCMTLMQAETRIFPGLTSKDWYYSLGETLRVPVSKQSRQLTTFAVEESAYVDFHKSQGNESGQVFTFRLFLKEETDLETAMMKIIELRKKIGLEDFLFRENLGRH